MAMLGCVLSDLYTKPSHCLEQLCAIIVCGGDGWERQLVSHNDLTDDMRQNNTK